MLTKHLERVYKKLMTEEKARTEKEKFINYLQNQMVLIADYEFQAGYSKLDKHTFRCH